jgi:hypothetical protein
MNNCTPGEGFRKKMEKKLAAAIKTDTRKSNQIPSGQPKVEETPKKEAEAPKTNRRDDFYTRQRDVTLKEVKIGQTFRSGSHIYRLLARNQNSATVKEQKTRTAVMRRGQFDQKEIILNTENVTRIGVNSIIDEILL